MMKSYIKTILRELFCYLPAYYFIFHGLILLYVSLSWLNPPETGMTWLAIFPLLTGYLFYAVRIHLDEKIKNKRFWLLVLGILLAGLTLGIKIFSNPIMMGHTWENHIDRIKIIYEFSNLIWFIIILIHCYWRLGLKGMTRYFGVAFLYGILLETGGITLGYFFEEGYVLYVPFLSAPIVTMICWAAIFYMAVTIYEKFADYFTSLRRRPIVLRAMIIFLIAFSMDIYLDPLAVKFGLWRWNEAFRPGSTIFFYGDPIINFFSWFFALFTFGIAFEYVRNCQCWCGRHKTVALLLGIPVIQLAAAIGLFGTMILIEGFSGPTITILVEFLNRIFNG